MRADGQVFFFGIQGALQVYPQQLGAATAVLVGTARLPLKTLAQHQFTGVLAKVELGGDVDRQIVVLGPVVP